MWEWDWDWDGDRGWLMGWELEGRFGCGFVVWFEGFEGSIT